MSSGILTLYIFLSERLYFYGLLYRRKFHDFRSRKIRNPCTFWAGETDPFNDFFSNLQLALEKSILSMNMWFSLSRAQNFFSKVVYSQGLWKKIDNSETFKNFPFQKDFHQNESNCRILQSSLYKCHFTRSPKYKEKWVNFLI